MEKILPSIIPGGKCYGVGFMAMLAILTNDLKTFDQRLHVINELDEKNFQLTIENSEAKRLSVYQRIMPYVPRQILDNMVCDRLTDTEKLHLSIPVFLCNVELAQSIYAYDKFHAKKVTYQDAVSLLDKLQNVQLEEQGGVSRLSDFSGIYSISDLRKYFASFAECADEFQFPFESSIVFFLQSVNHTITVGYHLIDKQWYCINANELPTQVFTDSYDIAAKVMKALQCKHRVSFLTEIFVLKKAELQMQEFINHWQSQKTFQQLHSVSFTNSSLVDDLQATWLYMNSRTQNVSITNELLLNGADINFQNKNGATPLILAAQYNNLVIMESLLCRGANPNLATVNGTTPLMLAVGNDVHMIKLLLDFGAKTNPVREDGLTSLLHAVTCNNVPAVEVLIDYNCDVNAKNNNGQSPLIEAVHLQSKEMIALLLNANANINITHETATPLFIAAQFGYFSIVEQLLQYGADATIKFTDTIFELNKFARKHNIESVMNPFIEKHRTNNLTFFSGEKSNISILPEEIAALMGHHEIAALIKQKREENNSKLYSFSLYV